MYFVDRNQIEQTLQYMDDLLQEFHRYHYETTVEKLALERIVHMVIESMLDVGNMMIDGFIMRDPGSFYDIIDILVDEEVLPSEEADHYKQVIDLRTPLVKEYTEVDHSHLIDIIKTNMPILEMFSNHIRHYLTGESKVATTFYKQ
ncbi:DUF86 domain-containing protein [Aquibacillus sediminis]|uniref:DUF86 domain-containing protein n=1 Tax=Aquibacillus sediminis TaxID=2574734 RepID=UPI00110860DE|nr:DUF86 domain-containing protein [Aquibacillus sediminis]